MNLLQLQYFKALAEREHLGKTAEELRISAPSLSATIARLERELDVRLFDRSGKHIRLNNFGRMYLEHVKNIFTSLDNAQKELKDAKKEKNNKIFIAMSSPTIYHQTFQAFLKEQPDISTSYTIIKVENWLDPSYLFQFDFILTTSTDIIGDDWEYEILCPDDKAMLVVYKGHPFETRTSVNFIETKEERFIALSKGYSTRKFFDSLCAAGNFTPNIILECDYQMRSKLVAEKYGITITTESGARSAAWNNGIRFIGISDPGMCRPQALIWNKRKYMTRSAMIFRDFITSYYKEHLFGC